MEQDRFDQLARGLAAARSRRGIVRQLAGTALGGALAAVGVGAVAAKPQHATTRHRAHHPAAADVADQAPPSAAIPSADPHAARHKKKHSCPTGQTRCTVGKKKNGKKKKTCVDLQTNAQHCGSCATKCAADETCLAGQCHVCVPDCVGKQCGANGCGGSCGSCPSGQACQQGQCVCVPDCVGKQCGDDGCGGTCGNVCALPHTTVNKCVGGMCEPSQCESGWGYCGGDFSQGCATDLTTDSNNCGGCGIVCGTDQTCSAGQCACVAGLTMCNGTCVDTQTDPANCGACGTACSLPNATATCSGGACAIASCDAGYADCDGKPANGCETDITADTGNCGGCGVTCAAEQFCREFQPGCGGQYLCCQPNGAVCFNACDCCSAASGGGCAFINGGQNPGICV